MKAFLQNDDPFLSFVGQRFLQMNSSTHLPLKISKLFTYWQVDSILYI
ncbi:hypothetical protein HMPREF9374_0765 [Desmospora sp. 8437]|nr:hypothetical protein HMPREF9374_0765 [Desmospora sp. 8437]